MNSREISRLIGKRVWLRRLGFGAIFLTTLREWYIARALRRLTADHRFKSALDAGCGLGQHSWSLARRHPALAITAIEQDAGECADLVDFFSRQHLKNVVVRTADLTIDGLGGPADLILCCSVLEHIQDDRQLLRRFREQLTADGRLLIYVPTGERRILKSLERRIAAMTRQAGASLPHGHVRYYTPALLASRLEAEGYLLEERRITYGPYGRLAYDLVTRVQFSRYFLVIFPFYLLLLHPLVLGLMAVDFLRINHEGNGLLVIARKRPGFSPEGVTDAA